MSYIWIYNMLAAATAAVDYISVSNTIAFFMHKSPNEKSIWFKSVSGDGISDGSHGIISNHAAAAVINIAIVYYYWTFAIDLGGKKTKYNITAIIIIN